MEWDFELNEAVARFAVFAAIFLIMALFEFLVPRRALSYSRARRWTTNWGIVLIDSLVVRLVFPAAAVGAALFAADRGWGLFNLIDMPGWLAGIVAFVVLDFSVWAFHLAAHKWPLLWRVHRMHHADPDFDVTTAIRFHPIEILVSMVWKALIVVVLGAPALAVLVFEMVLNGGAMFNHANVRLPLGIDRILRLVVVTPDMHRVHHSVIPSETNSNYGFNLSIWDRLFATYVDQPAAGHRDMHIGLSEFQDERPTRLGWILALPFMRSRR